MQVWVSIDGKTSIDASTHKTPLGFQGVLAFTERTNWSTVYRYRRSVPIDRLDRRNALLDAFAALQEI